MKNGGLSTTLRAKLILVYFEKCNIVTHLEKSPNSGRHALKIITCSESYNFMCGVIFKEHSCLFKLYIIHAYTFSLSTT